MSDSTPSLASLTPEQLAKLQERLRALRGEAPAQAAISRRAGTGPVPLSFAQQRLWFQDQLDPGAVLFNCPIQLRMRGELDRSVLARVLDEIVRRHEILRTTFEASEDGPVQIVHPPAPVRVTEVDFSAEPDPAAAADAYVRAETGRPFLLDREPGLRPFVVRTGPADHLLVLMFHHIVLDAWASGVMLHELSVLSEAFSRGEPSPLAEPALQYADFAAWQRQQLSGEPLEKLLAYWMGQLADAPEALGLVPDFARVPGEPFRAARLPVRVGGDTVRALRRAAQAEGATLYMLLLAAYLVLLRRVSGDTDVVVGSFLGGRTRPETESLLGTFVNTLALRFRAEGARDFPTLLRHVRETVLDAHRHQDLPFERLVEELAPVREAGRVPLIHTAFNLPKATLPVVDLPGVLVEIVPIPGPAAGVDLHWALDEQPEMIGGTLEYDARQFAPETAARYVRLYVALLEEIAANPAAPLDALCRPTAEERRTLEAWNATDRGYPRGACVHDLFAAQASKSPDAPALVFRGEALTYAELDRRSNRLANHLRKMGVGVETRVGVSLERAPELIVALLAVLKAGGAYVPLDPNYPRERLGYMTEDAGVRLVLTTSHLADRLPEGLEAIRLDALRAAIEAESDEAPRVDVDPENLSHVIFTSGSTGRPKGVMIRHASTVVLLHWLRENVSDDERAAVLGSTSINFDVSIAEIFGTLAWGGKLVLVENALDLPNVADQEIRYASMVPTAAAELLRSNGIPASVRTLNLGGEALPNDLAQALYALGSVERVGNLYGPTEDTTYSTYSVVARGADRVFVGRPVANTRIHVLDDGLLPVPIGVVGELYISGDGLSRGYAGRPDLTAERFVPNPFGPPGSRMYRVMDRVRWTDDGELEYFGRTDFQVKVRGFRIELGEIETVLRSHPSIQEAVAVVREDVPGDRQLAAYLVAADGDEVPLSAEMRAFVKERLPEHMVPSAFVALDALPLTPNGKVDRKALPKPGARAVQSAEYVAPRTRLEERMAEIWAEVLGVERVGAHDDFFDLGGHSLRATRVVSHVGRAFGAEVTLRALFEASTLEAFAAHVERAAASSTSAPEMVTKSRAEAVLAGVDELSEDELDRLLGDLSIEEEAEW